MSKRRLVITAVLSGRSQAEVARSYGVSQGWISRLMSRYATEGDAAYEPRSRRPRASPTVTPAATVELIVRLRKQLAEQGLDAGADTIMWHLTHRHGVTVSRATVARYLIAQGLVTPQPKKRPNSSLIRFQAEMPNECWQADFTHYRLTRPDGTPGIDVEVLCWIDDHSRYALSITAHARVTGTIVVDQFRETIASHGIRRDRVDQGGKVTLRHQGRLYSIGIGRTHARTRVILLVHDLDIRVIHAATGELLRELVLDPTKRYQPIRPTQAPTTQKPPPK